MPIADKYLGDNEVWDHVAGKDIESAITDAKKIIARYGIK
jgi:hypothetical protein